MPPEVNAVAPPQDEPSLWALQNLKEQVRHWESLLLHQRSHLADCIRQRDVFERAAQDRLAVIDEGQRLIRERDHRITQLTGQISSLREQLAAAGEEVSRLSEQYRLERVELKRACLEAGRGMTELAQREKALTAQVLELQREGLIDSVIRRISALIT